MNEKIKLFKDFMQQSMIKNYEKDGFLAPIFFALKTDRPAFGIIPNELLTPENKLQLAELLKRICKDPTIIAAGIIIEAYGAQVHADSAMAKLILNGDIDMKDIKDKHDIIIMMFSTPEGDEFSAYYVDEKTKTVLSKFSDGECKNYEGTFSHLFTWDKN